jgi:hypothetical protein
MPSAIFSICIAPRGGAPGPGWQRLRPAGTGGGNKPEYRYLRRLHLGREHRATGKFNSFTCTGVGCYACGSIPLKVGLADAKGESGVFDYYLE